MSRVERKPAFCTCENKDADQLRGNREADQRLCFRYMDSVIPLLSNSEISRLYPGLCGTWSEIPKTGNLTTRLKYHTTYAAMNNKGANRYEEQAELHLCCCVLSYGLW